MITWFARFKMKGWKCTSLVGLIFLLLLQSSGQNSRQKRQIATGQPRIVTQDGHLIFQTGANHNISFKSSAGGAITVDGEDLKSIAQGVKDNKANIDQLVNAPTSVPTNVQNQLNTLKGRLDNLQPTGQVQSDIINLKGRVTTVETRTTTAATSITILGNRLDNLQPTGAVRTQLNTLTSRMGTVETRVSVLEHNTSNAALQTRVNVLRRMRQRGGISTSRLSSVGMIRRIRNRVQTLETKVNHLETLLTTNECNPGPCLNGGTCVDLYNGYFCMCGEHWTGSTCTTDVNECTLYIGTERGCQNRATCTNTQGSFTCHCAPNWYGRLCTQQYDDCTRSSPGALCVHGTCVNVQRTVTNMPKFDCVCQDGWTKQSATNPACDVDVNECNAPSPPCSTDPLVRCINTPGSFTCGLCPTGYTGNGFTCQDVNECATNNGGCSISPLVACINTRGSRRCGACPPGYQGNGVTCNYVGICNVNNGGCHPLATCTDSGSALGGRTCTCPAGYLGNGAGANGCIQGGTTPSCNPNPCLHSGSCSMSGTTVVCTCATGYTGSRCETHIQPCAVNPCLNSGTCTVQGDTFSCSCTSDFTGNRCQTPQSSCGGSLRDETGSFRYPTNTGSQYPHGANCAWTITTTRDRFENKNGCPDYPPVGTITALPYNALVDLLHTAVAVVPEFDQTVKSLLPKTGYYHVTRLLFEIDNNNAYNILILTFPLFNLEQHRSCNYDYLQIHDGLTASSHILGKWCGTVPPGNGTLNTTSNNAYLWFYSDSSIAGDGFAVNWTTADPVCGGDFTTSYGTINSPGYPGNYPHNRDCVWTVSVTLGKRIIFAFAAIALEHHPNCSFDYLEIRDGLLDSSPLLHRYCTSGNQAPLRTTGNTAWLKFHSDQSLSDQGFHITYTTINGPCGADLTDDQGNIQSPNFPQPYRHNAQCAWTITVSPGDRIQLTFSTFDLETSSSCTYDKVEVRDGLDQTAPLLGQFCGTDQPAVQQSTSNVMYIYFRSDVSLNGQGFQASYTVVCGGTFTTPTGTLQSPNFPNNYAHNRECIYLINQPSNFRVRLTFTSFGLEGNSNAACTFDYVEVRDGGSATAPLLGRFCGIELPEVQASSQNQMWIKFKADGSIANTGFQATYASEEGCGTTLTGRTGQFQSPGHPNTYPHGANCTWFIDVLPGLVVRLTFTTFNLEQHSRCRYDSVSVYDNSSAVTSSLLGSYCGSGFPPTLTSTDNYMTIVLLSDSSIAREGFAASYTTLNASTLCGADLTTQTGVITSPNYPGNYPHDRECIWTITVPTGSQILLNFTDFSVEYHSNCNYDYLEIRNGGYSSSPLVGRYCGGTRPGNIVSHSNKMYLKFKTDVSYSARGFRISYDGTATGCGADLTTPTGSFISPNYPQTYSHNQECFWTITISRGSTITLVFSDFDLESHRSCNFDYLEIHDGGPQGNLLGKFCGSTIPAPVNSTTNSLWIKYRTDISVSGRGFEASYTTSCNNVLTSYSGVIESPNFPRPYAHNRNCTWMISTTLGNTINASFSHFNVESHSSCRYDFLQIRNGNSPSSPQIGSNLCGQTLPSMIASTGENLWLNFVSDSSVAGNGFRLEWLTNGCGGDLTGTTGTFTSPNYPQPYPHRRVCEWTITVATGMSIQLNIPVFDLESHTSCRFDVLEVYGGPDSTYTRLAQLCTRQSSAYAVSSTGNTMFVRFKSDSSVAGNGFTATYTAVSGGCGGTYSLPSGTIVSKNYPNNYPHNTQCQWLISVRDNRPIVLTFVAFDVEAPVGNNCRYDYVAVYDGSSQNSTQLMKHCGTALPTPVSYRSTGNQMFINMRTDGSVSAAGFKATYVEGCGGIINASTDGEIFTNNYPGNYDPNSNCTWLIQGSSSSDRITLTFTHMDVDDRQSCGQDYVKVLDGNDANAPEIGTYCGNTIPSPLRSQGSAMFVMFVSNSVQQRTGFRATYTTSTSSCGGAFTAENGAFTSPAYPNSYPRNTECVWTIQVPPGNKITISFSSFSLLSTFNCNSDYLEIRASGPGGNLIGRYCGTTMPGNLTALAGAWIKFRSGSGSTAPGFLAQYTSVYGGALSGTSGQIASPGYPGQYPHNVNYAWTVTTTVGMKIRVTFTTVDIEISYSQRCIYDYIRIRNGGSPTSPILGSFCGTTVPASLLTTGNQMRVEFHTDFSASGTGFLLNWAATNENPVPTTTSSTPVAGCGGSLVAQEGVLQNLTSPGYPYGYADGLNCVWTINSPLGTRVSLNITSINVEIHSVCNYDYVRVFDNSGATGTRLGTYCGRNGNNSPILSSRNYVTVLFRTDGSFNRTGFAMTYTTACGGNLPFTTTGVIQSPNFPSSYPSNQNCSWVIPVLTGRTISVRFNSTFNIPSNAACNTDFVMLLNGGTINSPPLGNGTNAGNPNGRYCGSTAPATLQTSSNRLFVNFVSDGSGAGSGFQLTYTEVSITCGGPLTLTNAVRSGVFMSPNYPSNYPHNVDCSWVITAPASERIALHFEDQFNIEPHRNCQYDYVQVRDGGTVFAPLIGQPVCGSQIPGTIKSTGNVMFVRFRTDSSVTRVGFKARYEIATCGGRINGESGTITSINYPHNYDNNLDCEWYITTTTGHYLTFTFAAFNLQYSTNCTADSLSIREFNGTGPVLFSNCGRRTVSPVRTYDSFAYIRFKTDGSAAASGFSVSFQASVEVCGGDLVSPTGVITSPNYPGLYAHNRICVWTITVQSGRRISLTFTDFQLEGSRTCTWDFVEAFNGILPDSPSIGRYCGNSNPGVVQSSGPNMRVRFRTDGSVSNGGFRATYSSSDESECGGVLNSAGNVTSPDYLSNGNYTNNLECIWRVNNPTNVNSSIKIYIRDMALERHSTCGFDFLKIREGTSVNAPLLQQFCGNNTVFRKPVVSPVPSLWMRFKTDYSIVDHGFMLDVEFSACGGILTSSTGVITSPNYPNNYNHGDACAWQILAPEGTRIRLTFDNINIENHGTCQFDYLQVFNGGYADSPLVGTYCSQQPPNFLSQSNAVRLVFQTDASVGAGGFRVSYSFVTNACGGLFHSDTGYLTSPNFPARYPHNTECEWDINVQNGYIVKLVFNPPLDIEVITNCVFDYVQVSDVLSNGTLINPRRYCGSSTPPAITSMTNRLHVKFRSDISSNGNGFSANWTTSCGGTYTQDNGIIVSPGYPVSYTNNLMCNYTILTDPQKYISVTFDTAVYELEGPSSCVYDYVGLYAGNDTSSRRLGKFCGTTPPQKIITLGNMFIQFVTDRSLTYKGFKINYLVEECGGRLTGQYGTFSTIAHPQNYLNNHNCTWTITVSANRIVEMKFTRFDLETHSRCGYDYVEVRDGNSSSSPRIGRYCGTVIPDTIRSTQNTLFVKFITDYSVTRGGFSAAYRETYGPLQGCGGFMNNTAGGVISSVDSNGDGQYEHGLNCYWTIQMPNNKLATLNITNMTIEGGTGCPWDYIMVYDGISSQTGLIGKYCGTTAPPIIVGTSSALYVIFKTDGSIAVDGFNATYGQRDALCGGTFIANTTATTIMSPNFPNPAGQAVRCRWIIDSSADNKQVRLTVTSINLAQDAACGQEYLQFIDYPLTPSGRSVHYCGTTLPSSFDSTSRIVYVNYNVPAGSTSPGFSLNYQIASCNRNITGTNGRIVSPGWPDVYPRNINCEIRLATPPGTTVALYFTSFQIEQHRQCNFDYLEIHNGTSLTDPTQAKLCGSIIPDTLYIDGNQVYMKFKTDYSIQRRGYDISYTSTTSGLGCGGNMTGINGSLTNPGYPGNFSDVAVCGWLIQVPARRTLILTFETLSVQGVARCTENYVAVYNGGSDSSPIFGRYCDTVPAPITATGVTAYVKYVSTGSAPAPTFRLMYNS